MCAVLKHGFFKIVFFWFLREESHVQILPFNAMGRRKDSDSPAVLVKMQLWPLVPFVT